MILPAPHHYFGLWISGEEESKPHTDVRLREATQTMKCPICRNGETHPGTATLTLERGPITMVVRHVPAQICDNCGEDYIDEATTQKALTQAETPTRQGATIEVREFEAA